MEYSKVVSNSEAYYKVNADDGRNYICEGGGGQSTYNLPQDFIEYAIDKGILVANPDFAHYRKDKDGPAYLLSNDYKFTLGKGVLWLIGEDKYKERNNLLIISKGYKNDKYQLFKTIYKDKESSNCEWFIDLYNKNLAGNELIINIDEMQKIVSLDIAMSAVTSVVDDSSLVDKDYIDNDVKDNLDTHQIIYYGVPGTGKSFGITEEIKKVYPTYGVDNNTCEYVFRTTLHPEYSYYDFVGSITPKVEGSGDDKRITYDFTPGIFINALTKALDPKTEGKKVFLILEEMSRSNVAGVFGDIFQLLDRDDSGKSEYTINNKVVTDEIKKTIGIDIEGVYLPSNLYIYGSVNTSDQNVFVMDNAFKRRFEWEYVSTKPCKDKKGNLKNEYIFALDNGKYLIYWSDFYQKFNTYITSVLKLREDKQIGQFFIKFKYTEDSEAADKYNYRQICNKLLQYMWSDIHMSRLSKGTLFDGVDNFEVAYDKLSKHKNIFCEQFISQFEVKNLSDNITGAFNGENTNQD